MGCPRGEEGEIFGKPKRFLPQLLQDPTIIACANKIKTPFHAVREKKRDKGFSSSSFRSTEVFFTSHCTLSKPTQVDSAEQPEEVVHYSKKKSLRICTTLWATPAGGRCGIRQLGINQFGESRTVVVQNPGSGGLRAIGAGLPRTGNMSLRRALGTLLGGACYQVKKGISPP